MVRRDETLQPQQVLVTYRSNPDKPNIRFVHRSRGDLGGLSFVIGGRWGRVCRLSDPMGFFSREQNYNKLVSWFRHTALWRSSLASIAGRNGYVRPMVDGRINRWEAAWLVVLEIPVNSMGLTDAAGTARRRGFRFPSARSASSVQQVCIPVGTTECM